jgi:hypothetical protein
LRLSRWMNPGWNGDEGLFPQLGKPGSKLAKLSRNLLKKLRPPCFRWCFL